MFEGEGGRGGRSKQDLSLEMCNWRMPKSFILVKDSVRLFKETPVSPNCHLLISHYTLCVPPKKFT